jgi:hypothetical protein
MVFFIHGEMPKREETKECQVDDDFQSFMLGIGKKNKRKVTG